MKKFHQIIATWRKRGVQRYLDEAEELTQKLEEFLHLVEEAPPRLDNAQIMLLMDGTTPCLYAAMFALRFAHQFNGDLYVMHQGILAPLLLEQAAELQVSIPFSKKVEFIQLSEIEQIIGDHDIDFLVTASRTSQNLNLLIHLSIPVFSTRHPHISQRLKIDLSQ